MDGQTKLLNKPPTTEIQSIHIPEPLGLQSFQPARIFTRQELARSTGADGSVPLIAVEGRVYDLSACPMWKKAAHMNIFKAGADLTVKIRSAPHGLEVLERLEEVGVLAQTRTAAAAIEVRPGFLVKLLTRRHLHPMTVHFPIATTFVAGLFMAAYIVSRVPSFEIFALYSLVIALISMPVTIVAGVASWMYNYQAVWTPIWREKVLLSGILVTAQLTSLFVRMFFVGNPQMNSPAFWIYAGLVLAMVPVIARVGHLGGKITFPS